MAEAVPRVGDGMGSICIVGTGALAMLFGARLSAAGYAVTLMGAWPEGLAALRREGVRVVGERQTYRVNVAAGPQEAPPSRYVLVLVKAWQTRRAARWLAECLLPEGVALTLQNGLGNAEVLAEALGAERVAVGATTTGAAVDAPGVVRPGGEGTVTLGEHPRVAPLAAALRAVGFSVETVSDVRSVLWGKLAVNAAINPLTALLEVPNGALLDDPAARLFMRRAAEEVAAVAAAQGIALPYPDAPAAAEEVARRTAHNLSSMLQDLRRGAPTEIDAICGEVARRGEAAGVPAPLNQALWAMVREAVRQRLVAPREG